MSAIWKKIIDEQMNAMLDVLDENPDVICKFHFGEEFRNVIVREVQECVDNYVEKAMKNIDACWLKTLIKTENDNTVMEVWYEDDQRVQNGKIVE
jgi:hypothetical protein